jgi:hypothetical protein
MTVRRSRALAALAAAVAGALAATVALLVGLSSTAFADSLFADDFSSGNTGAWSKSGGTWTVVTDGSPVAQQSNATSANARLFAGSTSWSGYTVQARVKPLTLGQGGFAGLLARASGSTKFFRLALLPGNQVQLQAVNGSSVTVLGSAARTVAAGNWYTLSLEVSGSAVRGSVDGTLVAQATSSLSATGRIGLQTGAASANFDDVVVTSAGGTPSSAPATPSPSRSAPSPSASPSPSPSGSAPPAGGLFVATNGQDTNPGTIAAPLATIQRAVSMAQPGATISVRGGTYALTTNIQISKSGTASQPYTITAYNGEHVVIDGEGLPDTPAPVGGSVPDSARGAIHQVTSSYWRYIGLEIINSPYAVYCRDCSNDVFERLSTHDNYESGVQIQGSSSNNLVSNLDSYGNRDPRKNGESADGLAIKEGSGTGNVVRGARLWNNSDDGFDAWEFLSPVTIQDSLAYGNGYNRWNLPDYTGDGNGFKLGGGDVDLPAAHVVTNSMAWGNSAGGFIDNANPGALIIDHATAWDNGGTGFDFADSDGTLTHNLAVGNHTAVSLGSGSTGSANSWDLGGTWNDAALISTDQSGVTGPRSAGGSIPVTDFLRPRSGADVGAHL